MSTAVLFMAVSLDGYISTPDDFLGGADGNRLHACWVQQPPATLPEDRVSQLRGVTIRARGAAAFIRGFEPRQLPRGP